MSFKVKATEYFEKRIKRLSKKYPSLYGDLSLIVDQLMGSPHLGVSLGKDCFKIRVAITSKGKGKSGGARLITYIQIINNTVFLIDIFDKSEQASISAHELHTLIKNLSL